ncbi:hypothetical protein ASF45_31925 [Pseudorhodoferax sp. Leaf265]|nr:hypothetical protein ASF45_31925 [Pseudorhodoferax sp. Leaf265]
MGICVRAAQGRRSFTNLASKRMGFIIALADDISEDTPMIEATERRDMAYPTRWPRDLAPNSPIV